MHFRGIVVALPVEAVENHTPLVVELGQLVAVQHQTVFAVADNLHIGFQHLRREILTENEVDVVVKSVFLSQFYELELLLELAEKHHAGRFSGLLRLFDEHLGAEVHKFGGAELAVRREELLTSLVALAVTVVAIDIPRRVAGVGVLAQHVRHICEYKLRLWYAVDLVILEAVVE